MGAGWLRAVEVVAKLTDAQVREMVRDGRAPRFEPVKRTGGTREHPTYEAEKWNKRADGGVVRIRRTASAARIAEVCGVDVVVDTVRDETPDERIMRKIGARNVGRPLETEGANPRYYDGQEWRVNCQRCVPTWEARRRGWNVTAKPKPRGVDDFYREWCESGYDPRHLFPTFKNPEPLRYRSRRDIEQKMKQWGDGARAQIVCKWKGRGAHTFVAEQRNGKTYFICPQSNNEDYGDRFRIISFRPRSSSIFNHFARIDNLELTQKMELSCAPTNLPPGLD